MVDLLFCKRWGKEYLLEHQEQQKCTAKRRNFVTGNIVLIIDDTAPRNSWIMGQVTWVLTDSRDFVQQVQALTNTSKLCQPITELGLMVKTKNGLGWTLLLFSTHTHYYTYILFTHELSLFYPRRIRRLEDGCLRTADLDSVIKLLRKNKLFNMYWVLLVYICCNWHVIP